MFPDKRVTHSEWTVDCLAEKNLGMGERIKRLLRAVRTVHGCDVSWVRSVPVREMSGDEVAWEGVVEVFSLAGHPEAAHCYAWSYEIGKETQVVTMLEIPPVDSPQTAVHASIVADAKPKPR